MDKNIQNNQQIPRIAITSLFLGISSLIILILSFVIGILVTEIGIVSFFNFVSIVGVAAIICGILAKQKIKKENLPGSSIGNIGIILGAIAIFLTIFLRFAIFLFFIPWLGA
ncbi:MAG: hypothetical protein PHQ32_04710 [Firmicutes bacterium]|nr:hypothetical protein [Bacillota bacterium]